MKLTIPRVPPSLNVLMRMHYRRRGKLKELWRQELACAANGQASMARLKLWGGAVRGLKARVEMVLYLAQLRDQDNLVGSAKIPLDCMKLAGGGLGWIADDDPAHLDLSVTQVKCKRKEQRTEITVEAK